MKIRYQKTMSFSLTLAVVIFIKGVDLCFGAGQESTVMFDQEVSQLETTWRTVSPREYYAQTESIMKNIMTNAAAANLNNVAANLLANILSKEVDVKDVKTEDLSAMRKAALFLITSGKGVSCEKHRVNVRLLSVFLGKIRKERVKAYKPKPVVANVPSPTGFPGMAGMSPDAIKDPVAKSKYEEAIKENQKNNVFNARQAALAEIDTELCAPIVSYMIETFRASDLAPALLRQCMDDAVLTDSEKKEILRKVGRR